MLGGSRLVAFVATCDPPRARWFYAEVLGLSLIGDEPYALVFNANGTTVRVQKVGAVHAPPYTALGWVVDDMVGNVRQLVERGVVFERYPGLPQDDQGVWTTPDGSQVAWFKDPDGNLLSLTAHP